MRRFVPVCLPLLLSLLPAPAVAFQQTVIPGTDIPLSWPESEAVMEISFQSSDEVDLALVTATIRGAMQSWNEVDGADFRFLDGGYTPFSGYAPDYRNILFWANNTWEPDPEIIALTNVSFDREGNIVDADIVFNGVDYDFHAIELPGGGGPITDLESIVVHELGHALGLDHSADDDATMFASYAPGATHLRDLHPDDMDGVATTYPCPGMDCDYDVETPGFLGCSQSAAPSSGVWSGLLGLLGLAGVLGRRRRRRGRQGRRAAAGVAAALLLTIASPSQASTVRALPLTGLLSHTQRIVHVRVIAIDHHVNAQGSIRRAVRLAVQEDWHGAGADELVLDRPGGTVDGITTLVHGEHDWVVGEELVLFLDPADQLPGLSQAVFSIRDGMLERDLSGVALVGLEPAPPLPLVVRPELRLLAPQNTLDLEAVVPIQDLRSLVEELMGAP